MTLREIALKLLLDYEQSGKYANLSLSSHLADGLSAQDRAGLTALFYTAVERKITYDYLISAISGRSIEKISAHTRAILRLGLCQILHMDSIPDFAAVNETVKLAKNQGERSFVNGILRTAVRQKDSLPFPKREKNAARYYSVIYSLPIKTVRHFMSMLPEDECLTLFETFNSSLHTSLTVNTLKISVDELLLSLEKSGYTATRATFSPITVCLPVSVDPKRLPGCSEGHIFVQDEASALAAIALGAAAGDTVIDVCSAPGGKSLVSAILSGDGARIYSFDIHESKLSLINATRERLGITGISASVRDALSPDESLVDCADRVICDVPCSGLGVIAKKPDLRYKDIEEGDLPALQLSILKSSVRYLRRGGTLVYSTCTLNDAENRDVVAKFLSEEQDIYLEPFTAGTLSAPDGMITLWPHIHGTDGFFIAKLRKKQ